MPTAVEYDQMGDGSAQPPPIGDKSQQGLEVNPGPPNVGAQPGPPETNPGPPDVEPGPPDVQPGPPNSEKALNFTKQGGKKGPLGSWSWGLMGLMLMFMCFLGGVFGPPEFLALLMNFTIPADELAELQCPSDQVIDPNQSEGNEVPAVQDEGPEENGLLLPAVQKVEPSALSVILYEMFKSLNGLKSETEAVEFLPPNPCVIKGSLPPGPPPPGSDNSDTPTEGPVTSSQEDNPNAGSPGGVPEKKPNMCEPGWLPDQGCVCCGTTLTCVDGTVATFNPACMVSDGGQSACTCVANNAAATVGTGYHCKETGAACTP
jgi:hypothetical protein